MLCLTTPRTEGSLFMGPSPASTVSRILAYRQPRKPAPPFQPLDNNPPEAGRSFSVRLSQKFLLNSNDTLCGAILF
jgi:hypothetical protein